MHVCRMLRVHTSVRIGIVHTCGHVSVFCSSFVHQSVASARLSVRLMVVCMSVCRYVHMYLCRDERTSVCTVDIEN